MDVGRSLLEHCLAQPDDDAPLLVYADWLEEQDSPIADLVRAQLAGQPIDRLIQRNFESWILPMAHWVHAPYFAHGMIHNVLLRPAVPDDLADLVGAVARFGCRRIQLEFPGNVSACAALAWTPKLRWDDPDDRSLATLARSPHPRFVRKLMLRDGRSTFSPEAVAEVLDNPALATLERLVLETMTRFPDELLERPGLEIIHRPQR